MAQEQSTPKQLTEEEQKGNMNPVEVGQTNDALTHTSQDRDRWEPSEEGKERLEEIGKMMAQSLLYPVIATLLPCNRKLREEFRNDLEKDGLTDTPLYRTIQFLDEILVDEFSGSMRESVSRFLKDLVKQQVFSTENAEDTGDSALSELMFTQIIRSICVSLLPYNKELRESFCFSMEKAGLTDTLLYREVQFLVEFLDKFSGSTVKELENFIKSREKV